MYIEKSGITLLTIFIIMLLLLLICFYICYYFIYYCYLCKFYIFHNSESESELENIDYNFRETRTHYELEDYI